MTVEKELENVTQQGNINITKEDVTILFGKLEICQIEKEICQIEKRQSLSDYMDSSPGNGKTPRWSYQNKECSQLDWSWIVLIQKDVRKGNGNYRPIAFLNLFWKLLTGIINEKV